MKRGTVLVVDGNATSRKLFARELVSVGYAVVEAASGRAAVHAIATGQVEIAVIACRLPDTTGPDLARRVLAEAPALPLVAVTGWALSDAVTIDAGFAEVLFEPVAPRCVADAVERHLPGATPGRDRRAAFAASFACRASLEATAASFLTSLSDALSRKRHPEIVLGEMLARLLDTAGVPVGAVLLFGAERRLFVRTERGGIPESVWAAYGPLLEKLLDAGEPSIPSAEAGEPGEELLRRVGIAQAAVVPIAANEEVLGVLVLGAQDDFPSAAEKDSFIGALQSVSSQLGQVLVAIRSYADLAAEARDEALVHTEKLEAVGRLAGGVAHGMNDVLGVVFNYACFIENSMSPGDVRREDAAEIRRAAEQGAALTRQLLAFGRQQAVEPRLLDLNAVIRNMGQVIRTLVGEDVRLETWLSGDLPNVLADPGMLEQVVMNLTVNARDAMPVGGDLRIETRVHGDGVMLSVADTGTGMDSNTQLHLFEPFFTTKPGRKGAGLGLATVFGIVKQSGGEIEVESELGRGTTFRVFLPAAKDSVERPTPATIDALPLGGSETVVVVEHEAPLRHALVRALREQGYHVISEPTGQTTLDACRTFGGEIHLLVTDVVLPALSGPEIARRLRERHPGLRVLFVSGCTNTGYPDFPVGSRWFLEKPFTPWALAARVREALD